MKICFRNSFEKIAGFLETYSRIREMLLFQCTKCYIISSHIYLNETVVLPGTFKTHLQKLIEKYCIDEESQCTIAAMNTNHVQGCVSKIESEV